MKSICEDDLLLETGAHQWSTSHLSHTASPSCQICSVDPCISSFFSWFRVKKKKKKNWPPAGCSCFVGPGAMLQTHMTLWSEPPSLSRECHPHTLTSWVQVYSEKTRRAQVNYLQLKPCLSLRGARWRKKSGLFFQKYFAKSATTQKTRQCWHHTKRF